MMQCYVPLPLGKFSTITYIFIDWLTFSWMLSLS